MTPVFVWTSAIFSRRKIRRSASAENGSRSAKSSTRHELKTSRVMMLSCGKTMTGTASARSSAASGPSAGSSTTGSNSARSSVRSRRTSERLAP